MSFYLIIIVAVIVVGHLMHEMQSNSFNPSAYRGATWVRQSNEQSKRFKSHFLVMLAVRKLTWNADCNELSRSQNRQCQLLHTHSAVQNAVTSQWRERSKEPDPYSAIGCCYLRTECQRNNSLTFNAMTALKSFRHFRLIDSVVACCITHNLCRIITRAVELRAYVKYGWRNQTQADNSFRHCVARSSRSPVRRCNLIKNARQTIHDIHPYEWNRIINAGLKSNRWFHDILCRP